MCNMAFGRRDGRASTRCRCMRSDLTQCKAALAIGFTLVDSVSRQLQAVTADGIALARMLVVAHQRRWRRTTSISR